MNPQYYKDLEEIFTNAYLEENKLDNFKSRKLKMLKKNFKYRYSNAERIGRNIQRLIHNHIMPKSTTCCTTFKVFYNNSFATYAYLYSEVISPTEKIIGKDNYDDIKDTVVHKFYCTSSALTSQDGEYRPRFFAFGKFGLLKKAYQNEIAIVEDFIIEKMNKKKIQLTAEFHVPNCVDYTALKNDINNNRLAILLYIFCWIPDFYRIKNKIQENHMDPGYLNCIYNEKDEKVLNAILQQTKNKTNIFHDFGQYNAYNNNGYKRILVGQKVYPITLIELKDRDNIMQRVWREIYYQKIVSQFITNHIAPGVPHFGDWFLIHNVDKNTFDNPAMRDKYSDSRVGKEIKELLNNADSRNYASPKLPINDNFAGLSDKIRESIHYDEGNIILSDFALVATSEWVGRTVGDYGSIVGHYRKIGMNTPDILIFAEDFPSFRKVMFDYFYTLYCLNTRAGLIHTDLHQNNFTIFPTTAKLDDPPTAVYILGDRGEENPLTYTFKQTGVYGAIIDYSRAINMNREKIKEDFGERFTEMFYRMQIDRCRALIHKYSPNLFIQYKDLITAKLFSDFDLIFRVLSALDIVGICNGMTKLITHPQVACDERYTGLVNKIKKIGEAMYLANMQAVCEERVRKAAEIQWPMLSIIKTIFEDERLKENDEITGTIADIFIATNEIKYAAFPLNRRSKLMDVNVYIDLDVKHGEPLDEYEDMRRLMALDERAKLAVISDAYEIAEFDPKSSWHKYE